MFLKVQQVSLKGALLPAKSENCEKSQQAFSLTLCRA